MKDVLEGTRGLAKNPLGIIALFVAFVYGLAALVLGVSVQHLVGAERTMLVGFVVGFPVLVLIVFCVLVVWHHKKLYGPGDYRDDESFLRTLGPVEREVRLETKISNVVVDAEAEKAAEEAPSVPKPQANPEAPLRPAEPTKDLAPATVTPSSAGSLGERVRDVASLGVLLVGRRLNLPIQPDVAVGAAHSIPFDGGYASDSEYLVVEVRYLTRPWVSLRQITEIADRVLAAQGRLRTLGDPRQMSFYLLLVVEDGTISQLSAIKSKANEVLGRAGFPYKFDVMTVKQLRTEAIGRAGD